MEKAEFRIVYADRLIHRFVRERSHVIATDDDA